jgi:hypothetical protein
MKSSPVFTRTYDLLLWLVPHVQQFPRTYRFNLSERIQTLAMNFQDTLIAAGKTTSTQRRAHLHQADVHLEQLRLWMRFARDKQLTSLSQYAHFASMVTEVGKCLGAWIKNEAALL